VLAEISGLARNAPVVVGRSALTAGSTSRSDMATTVADAGGKKRPVSEFRPKPDR